MKDRRTEDDSGRGAGVVVSEDHSTLVEAALPRGSRDSRDRELPLCQAEAAVRIFHGLRDESEGVILPPQFPFLRQTSLTDSIHRDGFSVLFVLLKKIFPMLNFPEYYSLL